MGETRVCKQWAQQQAEHKRMVEYWILLNHLTHKTKQSTVPTKLLVNGDFLTVDEFATGRPIKFINNYYTSVGGPAITNNGFTDMPAPAESSHIEPVSIGEIKMLL